MPVPGNVMGHRSQVEVNTIPLSVFQNFLHLHVLIHPIVIAILLCITDIRIIILELPKTHREMTCIITGSILERQKATTKIIQITVSALYFHIEEVVSLLGLYTHIYKLHF